MTDEKPTESAPANAQAPIANAAPAAAVTAAPVRSTTCGQCAKRLDRKTEYYRNNRYFCNKRCWRTSMTGAPPAAAN